MKLAYAIVLVLALAAPGGAALAHHGWSTYEPSKTTTMEAQVQAVRYANPHVEVDVTVNGQKWLLTLAPVSRMQTRGVTEQVLKVGQTIKIEGKRSLDPKRFEVKVEAITVGGKTTGLRA